MDIKVIQQIRNILEEELSNSRIKKDKKSEKVICKELGRIYKKIQKYVKEDN